MTRDEAMWAAIGDRVWRVCRPRAGDIGKPERIVEVPEPVPVELPVPEHEPEPEKVPA